ncbi:GNAT family N-acetyltransferase [Longispora albida]|uniref:GNAT family N-acetyltransferase n=1 Tax=Longispora albida TaxID=203523 RepID=UPI00035D5B13|nr:GNAT family N-acetyltransferase [Longispora albida]
MLIREAVPAEYERAGQVCVAAYRAAGQVTPETERYATVLADAGTRARECDLLVAAGDDGAILGTVTFCVAGQEYAELAQPGEAEFRMLAVDPAAQGRGVGEALSRACVERARELGCSALVLCTREDAVAGPARRLYARLGFTRTPGLDWEPLPGVELHAWRLEL